MRLREFGTAGDCLPVLIDAPFAGQAATIADFAEGQSTTAALLQAGIPAVWVTDWKSATHEMRDFSIDTYLSELGRAVDELGGRVHLVGLCQGGWMSAMFAARFPQKVASLVLAGAPIDTNRGLSPVRDLARAVPMASYRQMVALGRGRMLGSAVQAGWRAMLPAGLHRAIACGLFEHLDGENFRQRLARFDRWFDTPLDQPGVYYLQVVSQLFRQNRFAKGQFVALGQRLHLRDVTCPAYLLAGAADNIAPREQVFAAAGLLGTPPPRIEQRLLPCGHLGLFIGHRAIRDTWPEIARWILSQD